MRIRTLDREDLANGSSRISAVASAESETEDQAR